MFNDVGYILNLLCCGGNWDMFFCLCEKEIIQNKVIGVMNKSEKLVVLNLRG